MSDTEKSSWITDHAFRPRLKRTYPKGMAFFDEWFTLPPNPALCGHPGCNLAEAAHKETSSPSESAPTPDPPAAA